MSASDRRSVSCSTYLHVHCVLKLWECETSKRCRNPVLDHTQRVNVTAGSPRQSSSMLVQAGLAVTVELQIPDIPSEVRSSVL